MTINNQIISCSAAKRRRHDDDMFSLLLRLIFYASGKFQVDLLIQQKANVKLGDRKAMSTPLHEAALKGHTACAGRQLTACPDAGVDLPVYGICF